MAHVAKEKGDLAVMKAMVDLTEKGYTIFIPPLAIGLLLDLIKGRCLGLPLI